MVKINYHMHTTGSDGKLSPEDTIKLAIELGFHHICITDHYPYPPWIVDDVGKNFHSEEYYKDVKYLIDKYKDKIDISFGAEIEFFPENKEWIKSEIKKREYDYILGAIHHTEKCALCSEDDWNKLFQECRDIKDIIKVYYKDLRNMIESGLFDSVGHFDLIKIFNENSKYFNGNDDWYKKEVLETLDLVKKSDISIEINTSGWRKKCSEQYPSIWILKEMKKRNIPITIGTDAHNSEHIDQDLERAIEIAKKAGYNSIVIFKNRKPIEIEI